MSVLTAIIIAALGYLLGSIPTGYLVGKLHGVDIRTIGSGNIGATNVYRALGKKYAAIVFLIDAFKGYAATQLLPAIAVGMLNVPNPPIQWYKVLGAATAILGHSFTCWLNFKGGKGVATGTGAFLALSPAALVIALAVWILTFAITRIVSVASMISAVVLVIALFALPYESPVRIAGAALAFIVLLRHKSNLMRLIRGQELTFKPNSQNPPSPKQ